MQHRIFLVDETNIFCSDCAATCGSSRVEELSQDAFKYCTQTCLKCHKILVLSKTGALNCFNGERSRKEAERLTQAIRDHEEMHELFQQFRKQHRVLENRYSPEGESLFQQLVSLVETDGSNKTDLALECAKRDGLEVTYLDIVEGQVVNPLSDPIPGHNED